jgi:tetratricopeptide (TPR) repeat protein
VQARALTTDGALAALEGDFTTGLERGRAAVVLAGEAGDPVAEALARWITGCGYFYSSNRVEEAVPALEQALDLFAQATTSTERAWGAFARSHRATAAAASGDREQGLALFDTALAESRSVGSDGITLAILGDLAGWLISLGETPTGRGGHGEELSRARDLLHEALALAMGRRGPWLVLYPLHSLALIDALEGDAATAARRLGAADALTNLSGLETPTYFQERVNQATALARDALGEEAFATLWEVGRADPSAVIAAVTARREESPFSLTRRQRDSAILDKLGVDSRTAAVGVALRHALI